MHSTETQPSPTGRSIELPAFLPFPIIPAADDSAVSETEQDETTEDDTQDTDSGN